MRKSKPRLGILHLLLPVLLVAGCTVSDEISSSSPALPAPGSTNPQTGSESQASLKSDLSELGPFGNLVEDIQSRWGFQARADSWRAVQEQNCAQPFSRPSLPYEAMAILDSEASTNELALSVWGASIATACPEVVQGRGLSREAFTALQPDKFGLGEEQYLNAHERLSSLGAFGMALADLEKKFDFQLSEAEWRGVLQQNCDDLGNGGEYEYWAFDTAFDAGYYVSVNEDHHLLSWAVAVSYMCPELFPKSSTWDEEYAVELVRSFGSNQSSDTGASPARWTASGLRELNELRDNPPPPQNPGRSGSIVVCKDGWVSNSGGKQGACSWHGGVK